MTRHLWGVAGGCVCGTFAVVVLGCVEQALGNHHLLGPFWAALYGITSFGPGYLLGRAAS